MTLSLTRFATALSLRLGSALFAVVLPLLAVLPAGAAMQPPTKAGWPLAPRPVVVRGFERPPSPWLPGHRGVDLAGSPGHPVLSATAGTITYAGQLAGVGVIVVSRGPIRTTYEPVVASVRAGATVEAGEPIGRLSAAGSHCSPAVCLHWGLRRGEEYLDPLSLLSSGPVRLLPLSRPDSFDRGGTDPLSRPGTSRAANAVPSGHRAATEDAALGADDGPGSAAGGSGVGDGPAGGRDGGTGKGGRGDGGSGNGGASATGRHGGAAAGIVVGLAAVVTVGGGLLIRRH